MHPILGHSFGNRILNRNLAPAVSYDFHERFLDKRVQETKGGNYTAIRGVLRKYDHGRFIVSSEVGFFIFAIL